MDINTIRGLATLAALLAFLGLVFWAYSSRRKKDFEEAASLPFQDDPDSQVMTHQRPSTRTTSSNTPENSQMRGVRQ